MKKIRRNKTKTFMIKNLEFGGNNNIYIQSMCNTKTKDVEKTVDQILKLEKAGCQIIRVAVLDEQDAYAIKGIVEKINIPLVADIHFNYKLALIAMDMGVHKIRINPGNIRNIDNIKKIVEKAKEKNIPIRIGVNSGSLPNGMKPTAKNLVEAAKYEVDILEKLNFFNICISIKATNVQTTIKAYELAARTFPYPLHVGVTEAGTFIGGTCKSSLGIGSVLLSGIGNTIRVSLTEDPLVEIKVCKELLNACGLSDTIPNLISCPTCGRLEYQMEEITKKIESYLESVNKKITVAIMGCIVNGPGEAREADIGIAGSSDKVIIFKKGIAFKKVEPSKAYDELISIIETEFLDK